MLSWSKVNDTGQQEQKIFCLIWYHKNLIKCIMKTKCMRKKYRFYGLTSATQQTFCVQNLKKRSRKRSKNMFKINNKDTRTTSLTWFWCRYFYPRTYFQLFLARSSVSFVDLEHVCIYWEQPQLNTLIFSKLILQLLIFGSFHSL